MVRHWIMHFYYMSVQSDCWLGTVEAFEYSEAMLKTQIWDDLSVLTWRQSSEDGYRVVIEEATHPQVDRLLS